jgi:hypothetical protein
VSAGVDTLGFLTPLAGAADFRAFDRPGWVRVGLGSALIRREMLRGIRRRAESA